MTRLPSPDIVIQSLDDYYFNSDQKHIYRLNREKIAEILLTFDQIQHVNLITTENFKSIEDGIQSNWHELYFSIIGKHLAISEPNFPQIAEWVKSLMTSNNYIVRRNVVDITALFTNIELNRTIIKIGLLDKSLSVFETTIFKVLYNFRDDKELMTLLNNRIKTIKNLHKRRFYQTQLKLHIDGYLITRKNGKSVDFEIVANKGDYLYCSISRDEFDQITDIRGFINQKLLKY